MTYKKNNSGSYLSPSEYQPRYCDLCGDGFSEERLVMLKFIGGVLGVLIVVGLLLVAGVSLFIMFFPWSLIAILECYSWKGLRALERRKRERKPHKVVDLTDIYRLQ